MAAIAIGAPLWNHGDRAGCVRAYMATAKKYAGQSAHLAAAIERTKGQSTSSQGWTLRRAFDDILAGRDGGTADFGDCSWLWIVAACFAVGIVGAALRSACARRRVSDAPGTTTATATTATGANHGHGGPGVPMVVVAKLDPNQFGDFTPSAVVVRGAPMETDIDTVVGNSSSARHSSTAVQAIVVASGEGEASGASSSVDGEPITVHALP